MWTKIGQYRIDEKIANMSSIFEAICRLGGEATLNQIRSYLREQLKRNNSSIVKLLQEKYEKGEILQAEKDRELRKLLKPISEKTIQRCARDDPRIDWDGKMYFVPENVRLELRNLDPEWSGLEIFRETMHRYLPDDPVKKVSDFIQRIGAFIFFSFIEAARPFNDKSLNWVEREYLVRYWAQHAVPVDDMFTFFRANFGDKRKQDWNRPFLEMKEESIKQLSEEVKAAFPKIFEDLSRGREEAISRKEIS